MFNDALHIAVLAGDGIGPEVMAPALEVLRQIEAGSDLKFRFTEAPAGANHYVETGRSMPESTLRLCEEADAILLGACGLPSVRYPDNTEIMPQVELRFHFDLYAGVRPARLIPGVPSPIVGADQRGIDLVVIRESTEGLFASMGKGIITDQEARETLVITRKTSERLFESTRSPQPWGRRPYVCSADWEWMSFYPQEQTCCGQQLSIPAIGRSHGGRETPNPNLLRQWSRCHRLSLRIMHGHAIGFLSDAARGHRHSGRSQCSFRADL